MNKTSVPHTSRSSDLVQFYLQCERNQKCNHVHHEKQQQDLYDKAYLQYQNNQQSSSTSLEVVWQLISYSFIAIATFEQFFPLLTLLDHSGSSDGASTCSDSEWPTGDTRGCLSHRGRNSAGCGSAPDWFNSHWTVLLATASTLSGQQGRALHTRAVRFL